MKRRRVTKQVIVALGRDQRIRHSRSGVAVLLEFRREAVDLGGGLTCTGMWWPRRKVAQHGPEQRWERAY